MGQGVAGAAGTTFTDYHHYVDLAALATYTPPAQAIATLTAEGGMNANATVLLDLHDGGAWVQGGTGNQQDTASLKQDSSQNVRVRNRDGANAWKITLTGVTWA